MDVWETIVAGSTLASGDFWEHLTNQALDSGLVLADLVNVEIVSDDIQVAIMTDPISVDLVSNVIEVEIISDVINMEIE